MVEGVEEVLEVAVAPRRNRSELGGLLLHLAEVGVGLLLLMVGFKLFGDEVDGKDDVFEVVEEGLRVLVGEAIQATPRVHASFSPLPRGIDRALQMICGR